MPTQLHFVALFARNYPRDPGKHIESETANSANSQSPRDNPEVCLFKGRDGGGLVACLNAFTKKKLKRDTIVLKEGTFYRILRRSLKELKYFALHTEGFELSLLESI